jgi:formylglycine-generating enzyme required for sulfatase activity/serine/threonine protein phosphatase PrpC
VADGVGGGAHGEIASSVLLRHCAQAPKQVYRDPARLIDWLTRADAQVREAIARRSDQAGAATLAAAWFPSQSTAYLLNVGDCRAYQLKPGKQRYAIQQLTVDQTYANFAQQPPPNGSPDDPARMVGAGAVGIPPVVKARIRARELLLLCSDGVHKFVSDEQIADVVSGGLSEGSSLETVCDALVHAAKRNGGHDDASALLVLRRPWFTPRWAYGWALAAILLAALWLTIGVERALAETQSVIDPTEVPEPPKLPVPAAKKPPQPDAALRRERQRAEEEQRKRAKAEARALAAEKEAEKLRATDQARQADAAAKDAAAKAAARKAAAARAAAVRAAAANATKARIAAEMEAAEKEAAAREAAAREAAARELAAREAVAREAAAKEAEAREAAAKIAAAREAAARQARASRAQPRFGTVFRDCADCPELVWLPQGEFIMGEPSAASGPRHVVKISYPLAVGRFEITFTEWDACVAAGGCRRRPDDSGWGRGRQPVINVSWADAQQYAAWLSRRTGKRYRLLTEAEWEYAARAGSDVRFWWGNDAGHGDANCYDCGSRWDGRQAAPVGRFVPNPFGVHDMHGNVSEWVEDCYHDRYRDAPGDGRAWTLDCAAITDIRMVRGGAWRDPSNTTRSAARSAVSYNYYDNRIGFRIARTE